MRRVVALLVVALTAGGLGACTGSGGGYRVTAMFPSAVALYPRSVVKVMGITIGRVTGVALEGDHVEVTMRIDNDVPLPADVQATIVPLSLIGERNIVLTPPWKPGKAKAVDGAVIPLERAHVPVEPDEALKAVTDLAKAIDPRAVEQLITGGADAFRGHGAELNTALREAAELVALLAAQDERLEAIARSVHDIAGVLRERNRLLGKLLDDFATTSGVLADERDAIATFLRALAKLTEDGKALLVKYQAQLPTDIARLTEVVLTVQVNADSVQQLVKAVDEVGRGVVAAYDPDSGGVRIRVTTTGLAAVVLQPILDLLGLGAVDCIPIPGIAC
jgi:phospholipid/cholesterol/gamma-HCH transport system substrate-binding protein